MPPKHPKSTQKQGKCLQLVSECNSLLQNCDRRRLFVVLGVLMRQGRDIGSHRKLLFFLIHLFIYLFIFVLSLKFSAQACRWSPSSFNAQPVRCVGEPKGVGRWGPWCDRKILRNPPSPGQRFDFYGANQSRYYTPVAVGWLGDLVIFLVNVWQMSRFGYLVCPIKLEKLWIGAMKLHFFLWCFLGIAMFLWVAKTKHSWKAHLEASGWPTGKQAAPGNHWSTGLYRPTHCHQDSTLFNSMVCSCIFPTYIAMIDMYTSIYIIVIVYI